MWFSIHPILYRIPNLHKYAKNRKHSGLPILLRPLCCQKCIDYFLSFYFEICISNIWNCCTEFLFFFFLLYQFWLILFASMALSNYETVFWCELTLITYSTNDWDSEQKLKVDKISDSAPWHIKFTLIVYCVICKFAMIWSVAHSILVGMVTTWVGMP